MVHEALCPCVCDGQSPDELQASVLWVESTLKAVVQLSFLDSDVAVKVWHDQTAEFFADKACSFHVTVRRQLEGSQSLKSTSDSIWVRASLTYSAINFRSSGGRVSSVAMLPGCGGCEPIATESARWLVVVFLVDVRRFGGMTECMETLKPVESHARL